MTVLAWYGCDLRTGGIIEDLPTLTPGGPLSKRLGTSTTCTFSLGLSGAPGDWEAATDHGRSMLVAVDTETDMPIWAGAVLARDGGSSPTVSLSTVTPESYLDRRYSGDQIHFQQDQATVIASVLTDALTLGPRFVLDAPPTGQLTDLDVLDGDDRTALSVLQELQSMEGGPEWTVDVEWADTGHTGFILPIRVRPTIGSQTTTPEAVFDYPGCISSYTLAESYEAEKGATQVQARGEGEGASRLTSAVVTATALEAAGWPRYSYRFTPASGITDPDQLTAHAIQAGRVMQAGAQVWQVEAVASQSPRLGRDWVVGDTVRISVEESPRHPHGAELVARAWSWELDAAADVIRPIVVEED